MRGPVLSEHVGHRVLFGLYSFVAAILTMCCVNEKQSDSRQTVTYGKGCVRKDLFSIQNSISTLQTLMQVLGVATRFARMAHSTETRSRDVMVARCSVGASHGDISDSVHPVTGRTANYTCKPRQRQAGSSVLQGTGKRPTFSGGYWHSVQCSAFHHRRRRC